MSIIVINGKEYDESKLTKEQKNYIASIKLSDNEIIKTQNKIAMNQTAKNAYSNSIASNIPEKKAPGNRKNGIVTINGEKYLADDLNDKAKNDLIVLSTIEKNLVNLQAQLAIANTAKNVYSKVLLESLQ